MAKKQKPVILEPVKLGILKRTIAHFKRNPYKYIVALATTFVGLPTAAASYNAYIEPLMPAWHSWVPCSHIRGGDLGSRECWQT